MLTKVLALVLASSIEIMSINENYKVVKSIDIWQSQLNYCLPRAKEVKDNIKQVKMNLSATRYVKRISSFRVLATLHETLITK
jgi:hypothetical protein